VKFSFVLSTQPTRFEAVAFAPDFEANVARLAALGYDGIELAVREPAVLDRAGVKRIVDAQRLQVPAFGTGQAYVEEHLSFTDPDASSRARAVERIASHIALAREFNALVILGLVRGTMQSNVSRDQAQAWMTDALKTVAHAARTHGIRLAIEPLNRYETNLLNTVAETRAAIDEIGADHVGILFDTFHANIEEPQMEASLRACGARLFHVHVADSNRRYPGAGHIDFARIIATLREMNYTGWVSAEILPQPNVLHAAEQTMRTIKPLLKD